MRIPAKQRGQVINQLNATSAVAKALIASETIIRVTLTPEVNDPSFKIEYAEDWDSEAEAFVWGDPDVYGKVGRNKPKNAVWLDNLAEFEQFKFLNVGERVVIYIEENEDAILRYGVVTALPKNKNGKYTVLAHTDEDNIEMTVTFDSLAVQYAAITEDYFLTEAQRMMFGEALLASGIAKKDLQSSLDALCNNLVAARLTPFDLMAYLTVDDVETNKFHKVYMKKHKLEDYACYHLATGEVYEAEDDVEDEPTVWDKLNDMPLTALSKLYTTIRTKTNTEEVETKKSLIIKHLREICKSPKRHANLERMVDKA